ncbi:hypothetical protein ACFPRL_26025 [Pseudoclavibacter helvolus]
MGRRDPGALHRSRVGGVAPSRRKRCGEHRGPQRVGVEPTGCVAVVGEDGALVCVVADIRGYDGGTEIEARLEPAGMRAEAVRQDGGVERRQVAPQLGVAQVVVDTQLDAPGVREVSQPRGEHRLVLRASRLEDLAMAVDVHRDPWVEDGDLDKRFDDGQRVHARAQALRVHADAEAPIASFP